MNVDECFFEDEERDGFLVESKMKRFWAAEIEVLEEIRRICTKHNIRFFADWGTLLGAVRNKGFIAWDDDLDICMMRDDWFRFMEIAPSELESWFELKNIYNDSTHDNVIARVINGRHMNFEEEFLERFHHCPFSAGIDIFAVDYIPRDAKKRVQQAEIIHLLMQASASLSEEPPYNQDDYDVAEELEKITGLTINWDNRLFHEIKKMVDIFSAYYGSDDSDEVGSFMRLQWDSNYHMPKELYGDAIEMPFEYTTVPVPIGYDKILKLKYGDSYMIPQNVGGGHDYPIYEEQELALKDVFEAEFNVQMSLTDMQKIIDMKIFGE